MDGTHLNIKQLIAAIDRAIFAQVTLILHHPEWQQMESSWRGVAMLTQAANKHPRINIKLFNVAYHALHHVINIDSPPQNTVLFKRLYTDEYDQPGGQPFGLLIGDYHFSHHMHPRRIDPITLLSQLAAICALAFVPFIAGASAMLFDVKNYHEIHKPFYPDKAMSDVNKQRFIRLQQHPNSRFIALALPNILMRNTINHHRFCDKSTRFVEMIDHRTDYLWGNAAFAYGVTTIRAFLKTGWFGSLYGEPTKHHHGASIQLARDVFTTQKPKNTNPYSTSYHFTDIQEKQLADLGFLTLVDNPWRQHATFFNGASLHQRTHNPRQPSQDRPDASLPYLLCLSRFVHYLTVILRDKIGLFQCAKDIEYHLQHWLLQYCIASKTDTDPAGASFPLKHASVTVTPTPEKMVDFDCQVSLALHDPPSTIKTCLTLQTPFRL